MRGLALGLAFLPTSVLAKGFDHAHPARDALLKKPRSGRRAPTTSHGCISPSIAPRERFFAGYADLLGDPAAPITFLEDDWTLNDFPSSSRR